MPTNYITLSRQELYDMVWSEPMTSLAKEFGISDVALAKRCRIVDVPIPYRGYWARKAAGLKPAQTPLPKYRRSSVMNKNQETPSRPAPPQPKEIVRDGPEPIFTFEARPPRPEPSAPEAVSPEHEALAAQLQAKPPTVRADLRGAHAAIRRTALRLKARRVKDFDWKAGDRSGPIVRVAVAHASTQRALRIADAILRAAEHLSWHFRAPPKHSDPYRERYGHNEYQGPIWGCIMVEGEPLQITVTERQKQVPRVLTDYEKSSRARGYETRPRPWDLAPTGDLRLNLANLDGRVFNTIADRAKRRLEDQLSEVLHAMFERSLEQKRWREERRVAEEAGRERERFEELARERHESHSKLIRELERQAGAWYRARLLRRYVKAAHRQVGSHRIEAKLQQENVDFFAWASKYIEQLDPLSPAPRHPDQAPRQSLCGSEEAALNDTLLRLLHHDGYVPRKIALEASGELPAECEDASVDEELDDDY